MEENYGIWMPNSGTCEQVEQNKMGNPSNGPAAMTWLNMFCRDGYQGTTGHTWSQLVTLVIVEVKELNNELLNENNGSV